MLAVESSNLPSEDWRKLTSFLQSVIFGLPVGPSSVRVGAFLYNSEAPEVLRLDQFRDRNSAASAVANLRFSPGEKIILSKYVHINSYPFHTCMATHPRTRWTPENQLQGNICRTFSGLDIFL